PSALSTVMARITARVPVRGRILERCFINWATMVLHGRACQAWGFAHGDGFSGLATLARRENALSHCLPFVSERLHYFTIPSSLPRQRPNRINDRSSILPHFGASQALRQIRPRSRLGNPQSVLGQSRLRRDA